MDQKTIEVLETIKEHIREYLEEKGRIVNGKVRCIFEEDHEHGDSTPSASIMPQNPKLVHCFTGSCGRTYDIFTAAHKLEGFPIRGPEFWNNTIPTLATKYGIKYDPVDMNEDLKQIYQMRRFYADIRFYIRRYASSSIHEYEQSRGWDPEVCRKHSIGGIKDRRAFHNWLRSQGWTDEDVGKYGALQRDLFAGDNLIFPVRNRNGQVIGFAARYMEWAKGKSTRPKYINSPTSAIYNKSHTLYGYHIAKDMSSLPLYIVEGYGDYIRLFQMGLKSVVALGGTSLTQDHINMIEEDGFRNIVLIFDGDMAGREALARSARLLQNYKNIDAQVIELPEEDDPDSFFKRKDLAFLDSLEKEELFIYYSKYLLDESDVYEAMINIAGYVAGVSSPIVRHRMLTKICEALNLDEEEMTAEVKTLVETEKQKTIDELDKVKMELIRTLRNPQTDIRIALPDAMARIRRISEHHIITSKSPRQESLVNLEYVINQHKVSMESDFKRLKYVPGLNDYFTGGGIPKDPLWILIGGASYSGKSILLKHIAWSFLEAGTSVIYFSLDESPTRTIRAMISAITNVPLQYVHSAHLMKKLGVISTYNLKPEDVVAEMRSRMDNAFSVLRTQVENKKLFMLGERGYTVPQIGMVIEDIMKTTDDVVVLIDSFQQIGSSDLGNISDGAQWNAQELRNIINEFGIPLFSTSEMNKPASNVRPSEVHLSDTRKLEFNLEMIILVYNEMKARGTTGMKVDVLRTGDPYIDCIASKNTVAPVIQYIVKKNRITGKGGSFYMRALPWSLRLEPVERPATEGNRTQSYI